MTAYENGLKSNDTRFLLRPDSDFFKFLRNSSGKPPAAPRCGNARLPRQRTGRRSLGARQMRADQG